jgi:hypothetical protein
MALRLLKKAHVKKDLAGWYLFISIIFPFSAIYENILIYKTVTSSGDDHTLTNFTQEYLDYV